MSKSKDKDEPVLLPTGQIVKWNEWTPTEGPPVDLKQKEVVSDEYESLKAFFFPKDEPPYPGSLAEEWKREGRCPKCGELGRIHLSTMICSSHGPYT
jgi:hypothetical protein